MSLGRLAAVWVTALVLAAAMLAGLARVAAAISQLEIPSVPVVAIGSSTFRQAFPPLGEGTDSVLGDGRAHVRLSRSGMSETESLRLLREALEGPARTILLEIHAFAFDFADDAEENVRSAPRAGTGWSAALIDWSRDLERNIHDARSAIKRRRIDKYIPDLEADHPFRIDEKKLRRRYPMHLHEPYHEAGLLELIGSAREKGVEIVLVALPRSRTAARFYSREDAARLRSHLAEVARRLGLPLFATDTFWPDALFLDHGHLNGAGRARFLSELRAWWKRRHDG